MDPSQADAGLDLSTKDRAAAIGCFPVALWDVFLVSSGQLSKTRDVPSGRAAGRTTRLRERWAICSKALRINST
jgi:hypothetical protein